MRAGSSEGPWEATTEPSDCTSKADSLEIRWPGAEAAIADWRNAATINSAMATARVSGGLVGSDEPTIWHAPRRNADLAKRLSAGARQGARYSSRAQAGSERKSCAHRNRCTSPTGAAPAVSARPSRTKAMCERPARSRAFLSASHCEGNLHGDGQALRASAAGSVALCGCGESASLAQPSETHSSRASELRSPSGGSRP
eukprot:scaffold31970_cov31-Tisochrysis_lutea.AAC.8